MPRPARIDLRSDTITRPSAAMRDAIAAAPVGDDVYGEDPTVNALEARAAQVVGKEAALFVASGTMANQLAIRCHTEPGDEVLLDARAHPLHHEAGGAAIWAGVTLMGLDSERGFPRPQQVSAAVRAPTRYHARTRLLMLENTHNAAGGLVLDGAGTDALCAAAHERGLRVHLDGARLFHAAVALGVEASTLTASVDTVSFCLSKGLGAPIGSLLAGPAPLIERARRFRTAMGGAWRQAGLLAAAGLYALEHHVTRLAEDHVHARVLADALRGNARFRLLREPETNIVVWELADPSAWSDTEALLADWRARGLLLGLIDGHHVVRAVTHRDVSRAQVDAAARILSAS